MWGGEWRLLFAIYRQRFCIMNGVWIEGSF